MSHVPPARPLGQAPRSATLRRRGPLLALLPVAAITLAACGGGDSSGGGSAAGGLDDGFGSRNEARAVTFIEYYDPSTDAFWGQISQGARDAAELGGLDITEQNADGDASRMVDLISSAIATDPAAIYVPFNDPAWEGAACEADAAGIPVFAYNVPPSEAAVDCVQAFVGQDFTEVGRLVGERLLEEVDLQAGDKVLCPAEEPQQQYAIQRGGGVEQALAAAGVSCTYLRTGGADEEALNAMTTWLSANQDVKAVVPLGGTPHRNAVAAEDAAGVEVPIVGFDTSPQVIDGIKSGRIIATADQQGYVQGFQTVLQSTLFLDFGIAPADINSGGNALIDESNVANLEDPELQTVRW
ncbi:substrate-binding domain-containing protein [Klenkia sp. LSe6-5]|uniref:Substrate-binding domain-containing protein n=1 Tax=Klenkia sesuvii TaxID=3103137 RepID=A0ABU8DVS4_9ACTN